MARLCVRIQDNTNPDPELNVLRTQFGDVVEIQDDSHVWSVAERTCGQYRFFSVPGVSPTEFITLVEPVLDATDTVVRRRKVTLDADALKSAAWRTRTTPTKTQLAAITISRVY